jgi:hypothetical protein
MVSAIDERIEQYRREAAAARNRAASNPASGDGFVRVAESWEALADEVERLGRSFRNDGNESAPV